MKKSQTFSLIFGKQGIVILFFLFLTPFVCMAENPLLSNEQTAESTAQSRGNIKSPWKASKKRKVGKKKVLKPQYESCKSVDISSVALEEESKKKTEAEFCFTCFLKKNYSFEEVKEAADASQSKAFREALQKRVIDQVESRISQAETLHRACVKKDRNYFIQKQIDWPLMKGVCKQLKSELKTLWPEMRINRMLSQVNADQVVPGNPDLSFAPSHIVRDFSPMPKLTQKEQKEVKRRWAESLSETPLDKITPSELRSKFLKGQALYHVTTEDQSRLRKVTWEMQKKAKDTYSEIMSKTSVPLLMGYLQRENPNRKELGEALSKVKKNLKKLLEKAKDPEVDMGLFLSFKPLVEGLLKENREYCLAAEGSRIKAENDGSLENWRMVTFGIASAAPCFIRGPWGAAACLIAGVALGAEGYRQAQLATVDSLGRALTGKEFETLTGVNEKEREEMLAKLGVPLAVLGTTAVPARAASKAVSKAVSKVKRGVEENLKSSISKLNRTRLLSSYKSILKARPVEEQNVIMLAIRKMESKGLSPQAISQRVRTALGKCKVKK